MIGKGRDRPPAPLGRARDHVVEPAADALRAGTARATSASSGSSSTAPGGSSSSPTPEQALARERPRDARSPSRAAGPCEDVRRRPRRRRPAALHERPDAVARPAAAPAGRPQPHRGLRARGRGPGGAGRAGASCCTSAPRRACCWSASTAPTSASARTRTWRASSTSPRTLRPGSTSTLRLTVVKWSDATYIEDQDEWWHGGVTRSVFLYATAPVHLAHVHVVADRHPTTRTPPPSAHRCSRARRRRAGCGSTSTWARPATTSRTGWSASDAPDRRGPGRRRPPRCRRPRLSTRRRQRASRRALTARRRRGGSSTCARRARSCPPRTPPGTPDRSSSAGRSGWAGCGSRPRSPGVRPWSAELPQLYDLEVTLHGPDGAAVERTTYRVGFRRVEVVGNDLLVNGVRVMIRGVNRHDFDPLRGRTISRRAVPRRPAGDEVVRVQRRPDVALPERPRAARRRGRARPVRHRRGRHRVPRLRPPRRGHARVHGRVRRPGGADGPPRREPPERDPLVARQRERLRRQPRRRRRLGAPGGPDPPAALRGRDHVRLDRPADRERHHLPDVPDDRVDGRARDERHAAAPGDPVRVLARDGQQQRQPRRLLARVRVDPGAAGRVHLGVLGPRHPAAAHRGSGGRRRRGLPAARPARCRSCRATACPRRGTAGRTAATSATSRTTATSSPTAWCSPTARPKPAMHEHRALASPVRILPGRRPRRRTPCASCWRTGRTSATCRGCAPSGSLLSDGPDRPRASPRPCPCELPDLPAGGTARLEVPAELLAQVAAGRRPGRRGVALAAAVRGRGDGPRAAAGAVVAEQQVPLHAERRDLLAPGPGAPAPASAAPRSLVDADGLLVHPRSQRRHGWRCGVRPTDNDRIGGMARALGRAGARPAGAPAGRRARSATAPSWSPRTSSPARAQPSGTRRR